MEKLPPLHLINMKKILLLFLLPFLNVFFVYSQEKLAGNYDSQNHTFHSTDANVIVAGFGNDTLAPFMIKGKDPFEDDNNRVGFIDTAGLVVIKPDYINCSKFSGNIAFVVKKSNRQDKYGLIDRNGKIIIPLEYSSLSKCLNGLLMVAKDGKIGFITATGSVIIPPDKYNGYARPPPVYAEGDDTPRGFTWYLLQVGTVQFGKYIGVKAGSKWAVIDSTGKEVIPARFDGIGIFNKGMAVVKIGQKSGVINSKGDMLIPALYDKIELTGKRFVYATIGGKTGVLSLNNKVIIPLEYFGITDFHEGYIADDSENKKTLYDAKGNRIAKMGYNPTFDFPVWGVQGQGFFVYNKSDRKFHPYEDIVDRKADADYHRQLFFLRNKKWGIMDTTGREITPPLYDQIDYEKLNYLDDDAHKLIAVKKDGRWGVVNKKGKILLPFDYDQLWVDKDKLIVKKGNKYGFPGDRVKLTPVKYDSVMIMQSEYRYNVYRNYVSVKLGKKWALLDNAGNEVTPFKYEHYFRFSFGLARVKSGDKYGIVNAYGKEIVPCEFEDAFVSPNQAPLYFDNRCIVKKNGLYGLTDSTGSQLTPIIFGNITQITYLPGIYQLTSRGKVGMFDGNNQKMIPCLFDEIKFNRTDVNGASIRERATPYMIALKDGYYGLIDPTGKTALPFIYSKIFIGQESDYTVVLDNKQGLFNKDLKLIIPPQYNYFSDFTNDVYSVHDEKNRTVGLIKKNGDIIAEAIYQGFQICKDIIIVKKGDKFGVIDFNGKIVFPCEYSDIKCTGEGLVKTP